MLKAPTINNRSLKMSDLPGYTTLPEILAVEGAQRRPHADPAKDQISLSLLARTGERFVLEMLVADAINMARSIEAICGDPRAENLKRGEKPPSQ
jgi:hypothetical protein